MSETKNRRWMQAESLHPAPVFMDRFCEADIILHRPPGESYHTSFRFSRIAWRAGSVSTSSNSSSDASKSSSASS